MKPTPLRVAVLLCVAGCGEAGVVEPAPVEATPVVDMQPTSPASVDVEAPTFPADAKLLASAPGRQDATAREVTLRWPEATDDVGVVAYVLRLDGREAAREDVADAPGNDAVLNGGLVIGRIAGVTFEAARAFTVVAIDAAGNESSPLETGDALAPSWPHGTVVRVEGEVPTFMLSWPEASDDVGVVSYAILRDGVETASLGPTERRHRVRYEAGSEIEVVARDAAGHETRLPASPGIRVTIAAGQVEHMLIGALGDPGGYADVLAGGAVTGHADDILVGAEGIGVASVGTLRERPSGASAGGELRGGLGGLAARDESSHLRGRVEIGSFVRESGPGVLDEGIVVGLLRRRVSPLKSCYERELRMDPTIAGTLQLRFTITPTGAVSSARPTENSTRSEAVASCVTNVISRLRFPAPEGGPVTFVFPLTFAREP